MPLCADCKEHCGVVLDENDNPESTCCGSGIIGEWTEDEVEGDDDYLSVEEFDRAVVAMAEMPLDPKSKSYWTPAMTKLIKKAGMWNDDEMVELKEYDGEV